MRQKSIKSKGVAVNVYPRELITFINMPLIFMFLLERLVCNKGPKIQQF